MLSIGANEVWFYVIVTWEQITATDVIFKATWRRLGGNCGFKLNGSG